MVKNETTKGGAEMKTDSKSGKQKVVEFLTEARGVASLVADGCATPEQDLWLYRMVGSISKEMARGIQIGCNLALQNMHVVNDEARAQGREAGKHVQFSGTRRTINRGATQALQA